MAKMNFTSLQNRNAVKVKRPLRKVRTYFSLPPWPSRFLVVFPFDEGFRREREAEPSHWPGKCVPATTRSVCLVITNET
jgi:hypothetical protein